MQQQQAQDKILSEVAAFTYDVVDQRKCFGAGVGKEPVQDRNDDPGGILGRKGSSGENRDENRPNKRRPPILEPAHSIATTPDTPERDDLPNIVRYSSR